MRFWTFPQRDEPWASKPLDDSGLTCAGYGCFACSIAAVFKFFGKDEDPAKFIDWMNDNGGFDKNGMLNVSTAGNRYTDIDFIERIDCENSPAPIDKINSYLAQGIPVIAKLWFSKAGGYTHFVTIQDGDGSDYLIGDPWYGDERWLNSTSHGSGTPAERILGIRVFKKTSQDPPPPPPPPSCPPCVCPPCPPPVVCPPEKECPSCPVIDDLSASELIVKGLRKFLGGLLIIGK